MNLSFNTNKASSYTNKSQIARVLTENWVKTNSYCPNCGEVHLKEFENNKPVADFYCKSCSEQFELKSKIGIKIGNKIVNGAYSTMIDRINSDENPNFFFLTYDKIRWEVNNFLIIPKYYFTSEIIVKRKPLSENARRKGWVGCNIDITKVPMNGRIFLVKNSEIIPKEKVQSKWKGTDFLRTKKGESKGWILDVMSCVDAIHNDTFSLKEIYSFENKLKEKYPNNNFIKDKIRQQLQFLRDKGLIEFKNRGTYKKIKL
jgi:type II restriction enzyme